MEAKRRIMIENVNNIPDSYLYRAGIRKFFDFNRSKVYEKDQAFYL